MEAKTERLAVDTREAAQMLSVSPRTIQNYIFAKLLPARKIGRRTVIPVRALENFVQTDQPSPLAQRNAAGRPGSTASALACSGKTKGPR
jgi:excisionase family DNA binding protein